jgi:hypothetical protein
MTGGGGSRSRVDASSTTIETRYIRANLGEIRKQLGPHSGRHWDRALPVAGTLPLLFTFQTMRQIPTPVMRAPL